MKITDKDKLQHYLEGIAGVLDRKARLKHQHKTVNGYSVVVSDTVPTENDESVITLLVDAEYVPSLDSLSLEQNGFVDYSFEYSIFRVSEFTATVQALVNGSPVEAEYQFETKDGTVIKRFSREGSYSGNNGQAVYVRVRTEDLEDVFPLEFPTPTGAPNFLYNGMYQDGTRYTSQGYTAASAGYDMVYKYNNGVSAGEIVGGEVAKIVGAEEINLSISNTSVFADSLLAFRRAMVLGAPVPLIIEEDRAYAHFSETYTEDDIGKSVEYIFTVRMSDGSVFELYESLKIKDDPATDSFENHLQNLRFNPVRGDGDPDLDNVVVLTSSTSGYKDIYLRFELDKELAYDLTVNISGDLFSSETTSTVSAGSTYLSTSRTVWRKLGTQVVSDGRHDVTVRIEGGGYEATYTIPVYVATTEEKAKAMRDGAYTVRITSVEIRNFLNVTSTGNGRLYFTLAVDNPPESENYTVAVIDESQGESSTDAGTVLAGEIESGNSNLWYSTPLQPGKHTLKFYLLDGEGNQVSDFYTTTATV